MLDSQIRVQATQKGPWGYLSLQEAVPNLLREWRDGPWQLLAWMRFLANSNTETSTIKKAPYLAFLMTMASGKLFLIILQIFS